MSTLRTGQIVSTVVARFFGKSANFLVLAILARALSTSDLGVYGFIFISSIIVSVAFDVGVRNSVAYFIGKDPVRSADRAMYALLLFVPFGIFSAIVTPLVLLLQEHALPMDVALLPTALNILSLLYIRMQQGILLGKGKISQFNRTEIAPRVVLLGGTLVAFVLGDINLVTALYILAFSNVCGAVSVAIAVLPHVRGGSLRQWADGKTLIARGFVFMLGVVAMLAAQKVSFLVLSWIGEYGEAGLFYGLVRLTEFMTEIGLAVSVVIFSNSVRAETKEKAISDAAESTRVCLAFFVVFALAAYALAPLLLPIALGENFSGQQSIFRILLVGTLLGTIWTMIFPTLTTIEHPIVAVLIMVPNLIAGGALTWILYEAAGIMGAAWAMVTTQVTLTASMLLTFKIRHGVKVRTFLVISLDDLRSIRAMRRGGRSGREVSY